MAPSYPTSSYQQGWTVLEVHLSRWQRIVWFLADAKRAMLTAAIRALTWLRDGAQ